MKYLKFLFLLVLVACNSSKPINWANECAARFPSKSDTFRVVTESVRIDSFYMDNGAIVFMDTTVCPPSDSVRVVYKTIVKDCPACKSITKTVWKHDSIFVYKVNVAAQKQLETELAEEKELNRLLRHKAAALEAQKKRTEKWAIFGWSFLFLLILFLWKMGQKKA